MLKRSISIVVVCALLFQICGCTTMTVIPVDEVEEGIIKGKVLVTTVGGFAYENDIRQALVHSDTLYVWTRGQPRRIALTDISTIKVIRGDNFKPVLIAVSIVGGFFALYLIAGSNSIGSGWGG